MPAPRWSQTGFPVGGEAVRVRVGVLRQAALVVLLGCSIVAVACPGRQGEVSMEASVEERAWYSKPTSLAIMVLLGTLLLNFVFW